MTEKRPDLRIVGGDRKPAKKRKLTAKQERFVAEMIKGATQADAYRTAYSAEGMKPSAIYTEARLLTAHPEITKRLHAHES